MAERYRGMPKLPPELAASAPVLRRGRKVEAITGWELVWLMVLAILNSPRR